MTTYIPSLTLPAFAFEQPAVAVLFPVFIPVWTVLYAIIGYAAYRAWSTGTQSLDLEKHNLAKHGATLYTIQLGLNLIWMPLFFRFGRPIEATADIIALTGTTGYLAYIWSQVDTASGWLLAAYIGWLSFAMYLCTGCGYLNNWDFKDTQKLE
ncbi:translocator protein [Westerdykella ornata]|uniref:Translocator protein n=1 Tax=Westerdykella ornata TaxID=318751 RepID=A0A6A6JRL2_WESOR|nr:translocator protein [Westerdykella ornata]KAF2277579.1 translocator protein [Westerdykella ornata]